MIVKYLYKADIFYKIQFDNRNGLISTWVWNSETCEIFKK